MTVREGPGMPMGYSGDTRIGRRIARARKDRGLTQEGLVEKVNLRLVGEGRTRSWIAGIEAGKRHPKAGDLEVIAAALDMSPGALLGPVAEPSTELAALLEPYAKHISPRQALILRDLLEEFAGIEATREESAVRSA